MDIGSLLDMLNGGRKHIQEMGNKNAGKEFVIRTHPAKKEWIERFDVLEAKEKDLVQRFSTFIQSMEKELLEAMTKHAAVWVDISRELDEWGHLHLDKKRKIIEVMEKEPLFSNGGKRDKKSMDALNEKIKKYLGENGTKT